MKRIFCGLMLACLLLSGCSGWYGGSFSSVVPHNVESRPGDTLSDPLSNYNQICAFLTELIESGSTEGKAAVEDYSEEAFVRDMDSAVRYVMCYHPLAAYAVEQITYERGAISGSDAVAVKLQYRQDRTSVDSIEQVDTVQDAEELISRALNDLDVNVVIRIRGYSETDFTQFVQDYSQQFPEYVMELPEITVNCYPEIGKDRLVELSFRYQNSRDALRTMQTYVQPVFAAARLNVSSEESEAVKFDLMYSFLMERNGCRYDASLTPTYSLLRYGVGDSKAFAVVYAAMCQRAGLDCRVVSGAKDGKARFWNIIAENGRYYHVDLLESSRAGRIQRKLDGDMAGYVWDYSAVPPCVSA